MEAPTRKDIVRICEFSNDWLFGENVLDLAKVF